MGPAEIMHTQKNPVKRCAVESVIKKMMNDVHTASHKEKYSRKRRSVSHDRMKKADTAKVRSLGMITFPIKEMRQRRMVGLVGGKVGGSQQSGLFGNATTDELEKEKCFIRKINFWSLFKEL
uniref:Uncharacterized protein n=1 Tax=Ditylum brightwellii TaxID=49249 RepID=A0A7S2E8Q9_9STRA